MLRVLEIVSSRQDTGVGIIAKTLAKAMNTHSIETTILWLNPQIKGNIHAELDNVLSWSRIDSTIKKTHADLIHFHGVPSNFLEILYQKSIQRKPIIATCHGLQYDFELCRIQAQKETIGINSSEQVLQRISALSARSLALLGYNLCDHVIAVSRFVADRLKKVYRVPDKKISIVYNGIDTEFFCRKSEKEIGYLKKRLQIENSNKVILFVRPSPRKGLHHLVQAMPIIKRRNRNIKLVVVGKPIPDGYEEYVKKLSTKLGIEDDIILVGKVARNDLATLYSLSQVYVLPSFYDALPTSVLEAMACKVPVVAYNVGGIPEMVQNGTTGFLVEKGDIISLAQKIELVLSDDLLARRLGEVSRSRVKNRFSCEVMSKNILNVYSSLEK